ncbi:hypothetical protein PR048_032810 [Dryococelus australis]|uniref:PiggyBac transposable element-derived protein domain-containing protein n=1 Tax=Dryococelus australis TaxID=614101 RepID=A0ABQ9G397_9NEOP|nr:hypothetical protein PR048_032810 [Dryococelus australis]
MKGQRESEIPRKPAYQRHIPDCIPTCENPGAIPKDTEVWFSWLRKLENEGYDSSLSDSESQHSDHNTASEQSDSEQGEAEIAECLLADNFYLGKDRQDKVGGNVCVFGYFVHGWFEKAPTSNIQELWVDDGTTPDSFRATMSLKRFATLLRVLRFDDLDTREARKKVDNLAPIRNICKEFVTKCSSYYQVGEYVTIDEMLEAFRGRSKFRQYIANKPGNYGIKIYALIDATMFYTSRLEIYGGKQHEGPYRTDNRASSMVKRLITSIANTRCNITMDNYFTLVRQAEQFLRDHELTIVGTLLKNKSEIPPLFLDTKDKPVHSTMFGLGEKCLLVSYVPKKGKNILMISIMHNSDTIDE